MRTAQVIAALWAFILAGCSPRPVGSEAVNPAPSSSYLREQVNGDAALWALTGAGRAYGPVSATSSMAPLIDSRSVVLLEPYSGQPIAKGDWVRFDRGDVPNVLHRVEDVTATHVYLSGWNNRTSDGWFPKTAISYRLAGILYASN